MGQPASTGDGSAGFSTAPIDPSGLDESAGSSETGDGTASSATQTSEGDTTPSAETTPATGDDSTGAPPALCGDDIAEGDEVCDGSDLGGQTCAGQGFVSGVLGCRDDCTGYDTSACMAAPACGDGVKNGSEQCDGADLGGHSCQTLGWDMGALACQPNCGFDTSACQNAPCTPLFGSCSSVPCCAGLVCVPFEEICFLSP